MLVPESSSHNLPHTQKTRKTFNIYKNKCTLFFQKLFQIADSKKTSQKSDIDKKLIFSLNKSKVPGWNQFKYISQFLSRQEKKIIQTCLIIIVLSFVFLGITFYSNHVKLVPASGGSYTEVLTGTPKFINPLYASINTVDSDITSLVYSGLLQRDKDNNLIPDLADKFEVSEDERIYTFYLKKDIKWHDKTLFSADDIIFTFKTISNSEYKSPLKVSFEGVEVQKIDDFTIKFILNEPYAAFLELLTMGILPAGLWQQVPPESANLADLNLKPIGTGPYKFKSLTKDKSGYIRSYELEANKQYFGEKPYIEHITFKFTSNFEEGVIMLNEGRVEGIDYLPKEYEDRIVAKSTYNYYYLNQPQFTALFFNQNNLDTLSDKRVRQALAYAINKQEADKVPSYTQIVDSPILPIFTDYYNDEITKYTFDIDKAQELLDKAGWRVVEVVKEKDDNENVETSPSNSAGKHGASQESEDESSEDEELDKQPVMEPGRWRKKGEKFLIVTITTVDQPDSMQTAEVIKEAWEQLNIKINLNIIPAQLIQSEIIKPRNYQVLLYGIILGADPDQYPFWHSSQIGPNGLNLANYSNKEVDALLEDGRITNNETIRKEKYKKFQEIIAQDLPVIFLYSQRYTYLHSNKIKGFDMHSIIIPSDRFNNITNWYIETKKKIVW